MMHLPVKIYTELPSTRIINTESKLIFLYVLTGNLHVVSDSETLELSTDDLLLLPSDTTFSLESSKDIHAIQICLSISFMQQHTDEHRFFYCNSVTDPKKDYHTLKTILLKLTNLYQESPSSNHYLIMGNLYLFLEELSKNFSYSPSAFPSQHSSESRYQMRKETIIKYIEENYTKPITLQDLADTLFLSPEYTSIFFKKTFSMTFHQYLTQKRITNAAKYMLQHSDPLVDIALLFGFRSFQAFCNNFYKIYGQSPNQYRKNHLLDSSDAQYTSSNNTDFFTSYTTILSQRFLLSSKVFSPLEEKSHCDFIMNIGSARNLLSRKFQKELLLSKEHFQFRYVRIEDLVSNSLIPRVMPDYEYFFHNVYQILRFLYTNNFVPFIELTRTSYANQNLTDDISASFHIQNRYLELLDALLAYCTDHFPDEWLKQWKFELWLSPHVSLEKYCTQFQSVSSLIRKHLPHVQIGGPGFHRALSNYEFENFLKIITNLGISMDFLSIYLHLVIKSEKAIKNGDHFMISTNPEYLQEECQTIHSLIRKYKPDTPLYITEFTSIPDIRFPLIYSCYHAAFLLKNFPSLFHYCNGIGYWLLMDNPVSAFHLNSNEKSMSPWGQGLITRNGFYTPSYYVLKEFLPYKNMVQSYDNHFILIRIDDFHYKIIAYYYSHISYEYCNNALGHLSFDKLTDIYCEKEPLSIELHLSDLVEGLYQISRLQIDAKHSSPINRLIYEYQASNVSSNKFLALSYSHFHSSDQTYEERYAPNDFTYYIHLTCKESFTLKETLTPNSLVIWDIQRKYDLDN